MSSIFYEAYEASADDLHVYDAISSDEESSSEASPQATSRDPAAGTTYSLAGGGGEHYSLAGGGGGHYSMGSNFLALSSDEDWSEDSSEMSSEESEEEAGSKFDASLSLSSDAAIRNESNDSKVMALEWNWRPALTRARREILQETRAAVARKHPKSGASIQERMVALHLASHPEEVLKRAEEIFTAYSGWNKAEIDRHIHRGEPMKVEYLNEEQRKEFVLTGGPAFTIGTAGRAADTSKMWSKHSGDGWGIFVMDADGTIYIENHKMGMFHHSSFTAGANVAAAGEVKMAGGKLLAFTNKSGHYAPGDKDMVKFVRELLDRGLDVSSIDYENMFDKWSGKGSDLLRMAQTNGW